MPLNLEQLTYQCLEQAHEVGRYIRKQQSRVQTSHIITKELNSLVTFVDRQSEAMLIKMLGTLLPGATFITEEDTVENQDSELAWIIDPLDGTTNFLYGIPVYSISIALKVGERVVMGIVYAINQKESFYAWDQGGAYLNKKQIQVNQKVDLTDALIGTGFPYDRQKRLELPMRITRQLLANCRGVRRLGSAAMDLAYVAAGRLDGYCETNLNSWDVAAGGKIVEEAGGQVTDFDNSPGWITGRSVLAANPDLQGQLLKLIHSA